MGFKVAVSGAISTAALVVVGLVGGTFHKKPLDNFEYVWPGIERYVDDPGSEELSFNGAIDWVNDTFDRNPKDGVLSKRELDVAEDAADAITGSSYFKNVADTVGKIRTAVEYHRQVLEHNEYKTKKAARTSQN